MHHNLRKVSNFVYVLKNFKRTGRLAVCSKQAALYLHVGGAAESKSQSEIMAKSVGEHHNFPKEEEDILELWKKLDAFKNSLKQSEGKPRYFEAKY